jgi:hypothetical protein
MDHEEFKKYGLEGPELERWFNQFAQTVGIASSEQYSMVGLTELLNKKLPKRLTDACDRIYADFPEGNEWVISILNDKVEPELPNSTKQKFCKYLLDKVLAADTHIQISNVQGSTQNVFVDVTGNPGKQQSKIDKICGLPYVKDRFGENRNKNIPFVRKVLGIDKHIVLLLSNDRRLLPSYERLLSELQAFANGKLETAVIDLQDVPEHERFINQRPIETPAQACERYQTRYGKLPLTEELNTVAKSAFLDGYSQAEVKNILSEHEFFRNYKQSSQSIKGEELAQKLVDKSYISYVDTHADLVKSTIDICLKNTEPDGNGAKIHEGKKLVLSLSNNVYAVTAKDGRGVIFKLKEGEPVMSKMNRLDLKTFVSFHDKLNQDVKVQENRGKKNSRR